MNKAKTFLSAILLSQVVFNIASPALANSYDQDYNSASSTERVDDTPNWSEMAVVGGVGALVILGTVFGFGGDSSNQPSSSNDYQYRYDDNESAPSYESGSSSVAPIDPFYGDCHGYDCQN
ncbi:hypothetical protein C7B62_18165 [Pleurocapsa sp. CCALA 161]|uniref:hypothetical protein n=1 Tax=Pleurocapsa sp. CCALA 161 TaxID=2107688 RepID=UPI000D04EF6D|nr:hypothetical protein [Pleurocapsa sp. CCALA 161]PSB07993.1 hypothetical protein C7B62_18165 [Pleurocapsa sp. CCALA 161]